LLIARGPVANKTQHNSQHTIAVTKYPFLSPLIYSTHHHANILIIPASHLFSGFSEHNIHELVIAYQGARHLPSLVEMQRYRLVEVRPAHNTKKSKQ
jgi:hypothetical protein